MKKNTVNNFKLGLFVLGGLLFLVLLLYMIGKNQHLFGSKYVLRAQFSNVQGLKAGHNVRYSGIEAGTVKEVRIVNDTVIEMEMYIDADMRSIIRKNAIVSIGTEGFVGNKVVNISPGKGQALFAEDGDMLYSRVPIDTDEMLRTLGKTNNDLAIVSERLKTTVANINESRALWDLLGDQTLSANIRQTAWNIRNASGRATIFVDELNGLVAEINEGKGTLGALWKDSSLVGELSASLQKIHAAAEKADSIAGRINEVVSLVKADLDAQKGPLSVILRDSLITNKLYQSLDNIEKGTAAFEEDMEALKHNFLLRGYFRKLEKKKQRAAKDDLGKD